MVTGLLLAAGSVQAALTVQSNGTVYDDVRGISWDQDANAVKTLCDAADPIWTSFVPSSGRALATICASDGDLWWSEAVEWVAHLNANNYKGFTNWRLPEVTQPDPTCSDQSTDDPPQGFGYRCTGSELGHLFNAPAPAGLENPNELDDNCNPDCFVNTAPFVNTREDIYRSGTDFAPDPTEAWEFNTRSGRQSAWPKTADAPATRYVWVVRPGALSPPRGSTTCADTRYACHGPDGAVADRPGPGPTGGAFQQSITTGPEKSSA